MAHTPLFKAIQSAVRLAGECEARSSKTSDALERIEEQSWSRRRFLGTTGAALIGTGLGLPLFQHVAHGAQKPRVVIVGAGTAGLICAYRLQQHGITARIIEASTRVGGRMFSLRNFFPDNQLTELGGEYIDSDHVEIRNLARELELTVKDLRYDNGPNGHTYFFENRLIPSDADFIDMFRPVAKAIQSDLDQMRLAKKHGAPEISYTSPHGIEVDRLSITEWFEKRGVTGLIAKVLRAAYVGEYGLELDQQSCLNLLVSIGDKAPDDDFLIFGGSDERFHIAEGNDSIPTRLAQRIDRGIEFDSHLESIRREGSVYRLAIRKETATTEISADIVVLALPFTILRGLDLRLDLPEAKRRAIQELGYGTCAKLIAGFSKRVWEETSVNDVRIDTRSSGYIFTDQDFQCCWETSRAQSGTHALLTNFAGGNLGKNLNQGDLQARASSFASQVDRIYPGTLEAYTKQAVRQHWPSSPFVLGSYTCYKRGQYSTLSEAVATPVENLFFAGEHTSVEFNGYMEGAVETGQRAAREVIAKLRGRS